MTKQKLTLEQKKQDQDLWIIGLVTFFAYGCYMWYGSALMAMLEEGSIPVLVRTALGGAAQFSIAGLGVTVVCLLRKERFASFGLRAKGSVSAILLSILCFVPYILFLVVTGKWNGYAPLSIMVTKDVLAGGFPVNLIGMLLIALCWGFFEGFNYVVISDKINRRYPAKSRWLNMGAMVCAIICILFHPFSFSPIGMMEMLVTFVAIYGMLLVKERTRNAWGCVFLFVFLWNAF